MTPDELRRMDNDLCIIYEKGIKPVKAHKYYYFETSMAKKLGEFTLNHLEFDIGSRGKWRKYNPYNPYKDDEPEKNVDLNVESLDDLFEDDKVEENHTETADNITKKEPETTKTEAAPVLPQNDIDNDDDDILSVDIQAQLEAKFDELFGPDDDET